MVRALHKSITLTAFMESPCCVAHPAFASRNSRRQTPREEWTLNRQIYMDLLPLMQQYGVQVPLENMFDRAVEGVRFSAACSDFSRPPCACQVKSAVFFKAA